MRIFNGKLKPCASKYLMKYREKQRVYFRRIQIFRFRYFWLVWMSYMHISVHKHTFIHVQSISQVQCLKFWMVRKDLLFGWVFYTKHTAIGVPSSYTNYPTCSLLHRAVFMPSRASNDMLNALLLNSGFPPYVYHVRTGSSSISLNVREIDFVTTTYLSHNIDVRNTWLKPELSMALKPIKRGL